MLHAKNEGENMKHANKVPYLIDSHIATLGGTLKTFNGTCKPLYTALQAARFSLDNPLHGIVRIGGTGGSDEPFRYFQNGKEYAAAELFLD